LFRRAGLSAAEANRMREVVYAFLRGLAVRQAYLKRSYGVAAELSMITEMVSLYIDQRTAQAEGSNTRARGRKPRRMPSAGAVQRQRSG
jgi:hypothetical protein